MELDGRGVVYGERLCIPGFFSKSSEYWPRAQGKATRADIFSGLILHSMLLCYIFSRVPQVFPFILRLLSSIYKSFSSGISKFEPHQSHIIQKVSELKGGLMLKSLWISTCSIFVVVYIYLFYICSMDVAVNAGGASIYLSFL